MFEPNRLIYREVGGFEKAVTEGVPNVLELGLKAPFQVTEGVSKTLQETMSATANGVEGVMKGTAEVFDGVVKRVVWDDLLAGPRELIYGTLVDGIGKQMIYDTGKNLGKGEFKKAGKSFAWGAARTISTLGTAPWKALKGLGNLVVDVPYAAVSTVKGVGRVFGIDGDQGDRTYGFFPAVGKAATGLTQSYEPLKNGVQEFVSANDGNYGGLKKFLAGEVRMDSGPKKDLFRKNSAANSAPANGNGAAAA